MGVQRHEAAVHLGIPDSGLYGHGGRWPHERPGSRPHPLLKGSIAAESTRLSETRSPIDSLEKKEGEQDTTRYDQRDKCQRQRFRESGTAQINVIEHRQRIWVV